MRLFSTVRQLFCLTLGLMVEAMRLLDANTKWLLKELFASSLCV